MMFSDTDGGDIHNVLMNKYEKIPKWWYIVILLPTLALSFFAIEGFGGQLQLRYWGLLLALLLVMVFIIPVGFIQATTGQVHISITFLWTLISTKF
jgi:OPT oligopeptide transporter protein